MLAINALEGQLAAAVDYCREEGIGLEVTAFAYPGNLDDGFQNRVERHLELVADVSEVLGVVHGHGECEVRGIVPDDEDRPRGHVLSRDHAVEVGEGKLSFHREAEPDVVAMARVSPAVTDDLRELRNQAQHLEGKLQKIAADSDSVWGKISWVSWVEEGGRHRGFTCALLAGTLRPDKPGAVTVPVSIPADMETEEVALHAAGRKVRLDLAMEATAELVQWLEGLLDRHFSPLKGRVPNTMPDLISVVELDLEELEKLHRGGL